jgi:hypothetical protein
MLNPTTYTNSYSSPYPVLSNLNPKAKAKNLSLPQISLDEERQGSSQNTTVEDEQEGALPRFNSNDAVARSFVNPSLQDALGLDDLETPFQTKNTSNTFNTSVSTERLPDEVMLDTVRKRQANLAISTQDVYNDFKKTAQLLGVDGSFDDLLQSHFTLVNQEATQAVPDEKWIKTVLTRLAKYLDNKVSSTLDEKSNVVGEWLDALFTQPIQWVPMDLGASTKNAFYAPSTKENSPEAPINKAVVKVNRVNLLVMKDGLERVYTALQSKQWDVAENVIADVFKSVPPDAMTLSQRQQWQGLQFKLWQKQGKYENILSEALQVPTNEQRPELIRVTAEAYAKTGDYKEAIRTLHPLLAMPTDTEKLDAKTALKSWERLSSWAKELQNHALEHKMLEGYYKASKAGVEPRDIALDTIKRLQILEQLRGKDAHALKLAQERVSFAKAQRNKAGYNSALQDVASLYLNQGKSEKAQKVLALL